MTGTWLIRMTEGHWCNFGIAYLQVMNYNIDIHKNNISKGKKDKILKGDKKMSSEKLTLVHEIVDNYNRNARIVDVAQKFGMNKRKVQQVLHLFNFQYGIQRTSENAIKPIHPFVKETDLEFL